MIKPEVVKYDFVCQTVYKTAGLMTLCRLLAEEIQWSYLGYESSIEKRAGSVALKHRSQIFIANCLNLDTPNNLRTQVF